MVYIILNAVAYFALSYETFRKLQGVNYRPQRGYFKLFASAYFASLLLLQGAVLTAYYCKLPQYVSTILYAVCAVVFAVIPRKSPLKFTKRVLRMAAVQLAISFALCYFDVVKFAVIALPFVTLCSLVICLPVDALIARHYLVRAAGKLAQSNVTVIAVTGSYGKTSVKDMLTAMLDDSVSPDGSCNTPLGIARFINKTDFYYVKYLVLEFGARRKGDIAQLCKLFPPKYGIVTGICPQHLSTFKTVENIVATKRELVEALPADGVCVLNSADETAMGFLNAGVCVKVGSREGISVILDKVTVDGSVLSVRCSKVVKQVTLPQITAYTADTFAMCLKMCLTLKQSFSKTVALAANVKQTPHRMEISKAANCYIIDDGYNGSIAGIRSAAATLSQLDKTKVVITQGLVECGRKRREFNVECGRILGESCDVAIALGANKKYLAQGLRQTSCKVLFAKNLKQAVITAQPYLSGEGVVLWFQNDLP